VRTRNLSTNLSSLGSLRARCVSASAFMLLLGGLYVALSDGSMVSAQIPDGGEAGAPLVASATPTTIPCENTGRVPQIQYVADRQWMNCSIDASGNCFYPTHTISCPSGFRPIGGGCSIGGWNTTVVGDSISGNGWVCSYAESNRPTYAGQSFPVDSYVYVTCIEDNSALVEVQTVSDYKTLNCTIDESGNCHYPDKHHVDCPSGFQLAGGSCSIGGWNTTKTTDISDGNGWTCGYAESNRQAYAGKTFPVGSLVTAYCIKDKTNSLKLTTSTKTVVSEIFLIGGNGFSDEFPVSCPPGYEPLTGSCSLGGWNTTKVWDRRDGNGWVCKYGESNRLNYTSLPVQSTVQTICVLKASNSCQS